MADNKDTLVELLSGQPGALRAGYNPVPAPFNAQMPADSLSFWMDVLVNDVPQAAAMFLSPDIYNDPDKNQAIISNIQFVAENLQSGKKIVVIRDETPPAPPDPVTE